METRDRTRRYAPWLTALVALFCLRVLGQALVAGFHVAWLPPMDAWMSGLLPYPFLLPGQLLLVALLAKVCLDCGRGRGCFASPWRPFARYAVPFGAVYLWVIALRFAAWLALGRAGAYGPPIPIFFHGVLATFVLLFGHSQRPGAALAARDVRPRERAPAVASSLLLLAMGSLLGACLCIARRPIALPPRPTCTVTATLLDWKGQAMTELGPGPFSLRYECNGRYWLGR